MMLRTDFEYNGHTLSDWNMRMYDADQAAQWVGRVIDKGSTNAVRDIPSHYTTHYESVLQHFFLIIRDPDVFGTPAEMRLTDRDIHELRSWLEYPRTPAELNLTEDDEEIAVCYMGLFTDIQPFVVGEQCYGLKLTFTTNAPYGFSPETAKAYTIPNGTQTVSATFLNRAVEFGTIMAPIIVIAPGSGTFTGGTLYLRHVGETGMQIALPVGCTKMTVDCRRKMLTAVSEGQTKILTLDTLGAQTSDDYFGDVSLTQSVQWLSLYDGNNYLEFETEDVSQDLSVELRTRYILKAGGV